MPDKNGNNDASPEVRIRSDKDARFIEIRKIIEQCAAQNIRSIKFAVATRNP
jgi:biopolymer transport protein ExbD